MKPEEYIEAIENIARLQAEKCSFTNVWREELEYLDYPSHLPRNRKKEIDPTKCIKCSRCNKLYDPTDERSIHGPAGDYEKNPEVYIAEYLSSPWFDIENNPYPHGEILIRNNRAAMLMTEDEIIEGLKAVVKKWPNIRAWVRVKTIYHAISTRFPRVVALLTDWMERRGNWFIITGPYNWLMKEHNPELCWNTPLDEPWFIQTSSSYLIRADWNDSWMNFAHALDLWATTPTFSQDMIDILGRALASNSTQWKQIECASLYKYRAITKMLGTIIHYITQSDDIITKFSDFTIASRNNIKMKDEPMSKRICHTIRSRCQYCKHIIKDEDENFGFHSLTNYIPSNSIEPLPMSNYECVLSKAIAIRRRRLRGMIYCIAKLVGKARLLHFRPGIGLYYKEGLARWNKAISEMKSSFDSALWAYPAKPYNMANKEDTNIYAPSLVP